MALPATVARICSCAHRDINTMARLAPWVSRLLVVLIGYVAATIALRFVPIQDTQAATLAPTNAVSEVAAASVPSVVEIANDAAKQNIFGEPGAEPAPTVVRDRPVEDTKLNLKLLGVYTAEPAESAMAIISSNGKPEAVFRVGETITGRAVLKEVLQNEVRIDNGGRIEKLELPEAVASSGGSNFANLPGGNLQPQQQAGAGSNDQPIQLPDSPKAIRDELVKNPAMLGKLVSAVPYRENGRILGYKITPKQQDGLLANYGVLPGDVITRVNGIALANQKNAIRALRKLVKAPSIDISILRDGAELPVSIALE